MENKMFIDLNKKFILRNCFLLGTICAGLLYSGSARAGSVLRHMAPFSVNYTYTGSSSNTATSYTVTSIEMLEQNYFGLYNTDDYMEFDFSVISESGAPITISDSAINNFIKSDDFHKSYYTKVEFDSETNKLKISDKLVNQSVLDQALQDAGIGDMNIYAKTADVYGKSDVYTKDEADGKFLTSHQDISGKANVCDSYTKEESDAKYLTSHQDISGKANVGDSYTKEESDAKYLTSHQDISGKANVGDSYTKDESDAKYLTSHQDISGKANVGDSYTKDESDAKYLTSHQDISGKANVGDSYTKDESDAKYATQTSISDMLTKTEAGNTYATQSALNDYKTSNDNAVSALTSRMVDAETDIDNINNSAVMTSGITAAKVSAYEGYAAKIDAKQDALSTEQMAVLNSGITAADIATVQTANARLDSMDTTVSDLSADFGDVADFSNSKTGNLKNDVPSSSKQNASTVTKAIANMDATIGQIHGLAAKVGVENGGANLGQNTTVEEHLTSLAGAIGNRTHYTQQNYIKNNQTVAQSLDNLDVAVGSIRRDFNSAQIANEARFNDIEHNINHLENKMEKGLAANNALAALKPLSSTYQTQLSAAMGGYENNQAFAIGGFHYVTEKVLLNTGVAYGGNNSMSYNVGVTFGF